MRIAVTGKSGQVAKSLQRLGAERPDLEVVLVGRPELDLLDPDSVGAALRMANPEIIVSAAAYTAVDHAEGDRDLAYAINSVGAGVVAREAESMGVPIIHLSTDYVFDGGKNGFYVEEDTTAPQSVYGWTKLEGEKLVGSSHSCPVIIRTAWVYSPYGKNFVKTMLKLAQTSDELNVVSDQWGCPTSALDIARAVYAVALKIQVSGAKKVTDTYHFAGTGEASWYSFAEHIFLCSGRQGGPTARVNAIETYQFRTEAVRPQNSRLDCSKFSMAFQYVSPDWRQSVDEVVRELTVQ